MVSKKYYAARKGRLDPDPLDFDTLKNAFMAIFEKFEADLFFQEATGYDCVDNNNLVGFWGRDPEAFFLLHMGKRNLWPIRENIDNYDEPLFFSLVEFLYDYVSEPGWKRYHNWNNCGWHSGEFDKEKGQNKFRNEVNPLLELYEDGFELSDTGEVLEKVPSGLEDLVETIVATGDPENIDNRIKSAIIKFRRYGATLEDKKDAVRTLGDVLEFLRAQNIRLPNRDDDALFQILNTFDIRHHRREQQGDYDKEIWYDWMFFTFLASTQVLLKLHD